MPGLPVPSNGRWLDNLVGRKVTNVKKQSSNAVTPVDANQVEVIGPKGKRMTLRQMQEWLRDNPDALSGSNGNGPSFHKHEHGDTHIHVTVQAAPPEEPQLPEKSFGRQAAEFGASAAGTAAMLPVHALIWVFKHMLESNREQQRQAHELRLAELKAREEEARRNRFGDSIGYLVSHLIGFGVFMLVALCALAIIVSASHWHPYYWAGYYVPPPPPAYYQRDRDYDRVR